MNYYKYLLVIHWFKKIIDNKINEEILLVIFDSPSQQKDILIKKFEENLKLDNKKYNYKLFDINKIDSVDDIKNMGEDSNIILLGHPLMKIDKIFDTDCKILFCLNSELLHYELKLNKKKQFIISEANLEKFTKTKKFDINQAELYINYIEKKDPIKILNEKKYIDIYNQIFFMFIQNKSFLFTNIEVLQSNKTTPFMIWKKQIEEDISVLLKHKKLTSRLAVALYKSSTLRFYDSNTKIGNFYFRKFRINAKTTQLPEIKPIQRVKAYHLKNILSKDST